MANEFNTIPVSTPDILWSWMLAPPPDQLAPRIELPTRPIPALPEPPTRLQPPPWGWMGLARFFGGTATVLFTAGDSPMREYEEEKPPQWQISDLDPATHERLEEERRNELLKGLKLEQERAWAAQDFGRVQQLQNEMDTLALPISKTVFPHRALDIRNSTDAHFDSKALKEATALYGIDPQDQVADVLRAALKGDPAVQALLLRLPALGEMAGPLWPHTAHLRILWALSELSRNDEARVSAIYLIVREIDRRILRYRSHLGETGQITAEGNKRLQQIATAVAILATIANGPGEASRKADDSLQNLALRPDLPHSVRLTLQPLITDPDRAAHIVQEMSHIKIRAGVSLRDLRFELLSNLPPPMDLPSSLDETVSPHIEGFTAPTNDAEAMLSLLWPAPFDHFNLWNRLLAEWGADGFCPRYYEKDAVLLPLVTDIQVRDWAPTERPKGKWEGISYIGMGLQTIYDQVVLGKDLQLKEFGTAYLIDETERQPWPSQLLALSQIAIHEPFLSPDIVLALRQVLLDATTTNRYPNSLAPGAAEAAFDGLMRIASREGHPHAAIARRALWEVAQDSQRVSIRLRRVRWGSSPAIAVLRSNRPPLVLK